MRAHNVALGTDQVFLPASELWLSKGTRFTHAVCRLKRLGRGEKELAQSDLQMIPELAGNPFLPRIFQLYDQDGDGYITAADMRALLESLTRLCYEEERYKCEWLCGKPDGAGPRSCENLHRSVNPLL